MSDAKAAGHFVASKTAVGLLYLVTVAVSARAYDEAGFNYVSAITLLHLGAVALGSLGLADAVFYFLGRNPERAAVIARQASAALLVAALPVIAVVVGAGLALSTPSMALAPGLPWLALMVLVELPTQPAVNQLIASGRAGRASLWLVGFEVARVVAVLLPALTGLPLQAIPVALAATGLLRLAAHVSILRRHFPLAAGERWRAPREVWALVAFALPAGMAAMVGRLNPLVDKYVVGLLYPELIGMYTAAAVEIPILTAIPYAIGAVMQIRYVQLHAAGDAGRLRALWYRTAEKTALLVVPLTTLLLVAADEIVTLTAGPDYAAAATPFRIFTFVLFHRIAAYGPMLQAIGHIRALLVTSALILATNLILTVPLTWLVGPNGAAVAATVASLPAWLVTLRLIGRAWGGGIRDALPWRRYGRLLAVSWLAGIVVYVVGREVGGPPALRLIGLAVAFAALFLAAGRATGVIGRDDVAYLRSWIR